MLQSWSVLLPLLQSLQSFLRGLQNEEKTDHKSRLVHGSLHCRTYLLWLYRCGLYPDEYWTGLAGQCRHQLGVVRMVHHFLRVVLSGRFAERYLWTAECHSCRRTHCLDRSGMFFHALFVSLFSLVSIMFASLRQSIDAVLRQQHVLPKISMLMGADHCSNGQNRASRDRWILASRLLCWSGTGCVRCRARDRSK